MQTGQLDKLITIRTFDVVELPSGQEQKEWSDLIQLFANVKHLTGNEPYQAAQKVGVKRILVTIYNRVATITEQNQIMIDGLSCAILSITPTEDGFYLEMEVERRDNENVT
ncbi:MAG: phage head closure protein [Bacteroidota bacterium]|nr:phage head closure protein [Bacteroidota bacterium]